MQRPFLSGDRQQLPVVCPVQLVQTWRRRESIKKCVVVPSRPPFESVAEKEHCLTFSLIIQLHYIADVLEIRQVVDLNAATESKRL